MNSRALPVAGFLIVAHAVTAQYIEAPRLSGDADLAVSELRERIAAELAGMPGHAWAGQYRASFGWFSCIDLDLAPDAGFLIKETGCVDCYYRNYGGVDQSETGIQLTLAHEDAFELGQRMPRAFVPVKWGDRQYLIAPANILAFCNAVNKGFEPRKRPYGADSAYGQTLFFLRAGDENKAVYGSPEVPPAFAKFIVRDPVVATIDVMSSFGTQPSAFFLDVAGERKWIQVRINAGRDRGVLPGMTFSVVKPEQRDEVLRIVSVSEHHAAGVFEDLSDWEVQSRVGWIVSTRAPWTRVDNNDSPRLQRTRSPRTTARSRLTGIWSAGRPRP